MNDRLEVIYRAARQHQAHLLQSLLEEYNIEARIAGESGFSGESTGGQDGTVVLVNRNDVEIARGIVDAFDRHVIATGANEEEFDDWPPKVWSNWPSCPQCDARRQVCCPVCSAAGTGFELGFTNQDHEELLDEEEILLICSDCDEPFAPEFYRQCVWCGHDFGDGKELPAPSKLPSLELTGRPLAVLITMAALGATVVCYFWRLFS